MFRIYWLTALAIFLSGGWAIAALAADPVAKEGMVVSAGEGKLSMTDTAGKQQTLTVPDTAVITINGKRGKLTDLKPGVRIRVMSDGEGMVLNVSTVDDVKVDILRIA